MDILHLLPAHSPRRHELQNSCIDIQLEVGEPKETAIVF